MALAPSVQRKIMWMTPKSLLEVLCRTRPKFVIQLLCHWLNEKNPNVEERFLAPRFLAFGPVAKKVSQLSVLSILNLIKQDRSLWQFYVATPDGGKVINMAAVPYILLQLMFDLGGREGREKVAQIVRKCRTTLGNQKQREMLLNFKTETAIELFEVFLEIFPGNVEIRMCLVNSTDEAIAIWLDRWDLRMKRTEQPPVSPYWVGQLPGERAFKVEKLLRELESRRKDDSYSDIYDYDNEWRAGMENLEEYE
jgi:hypothetical protein